MEAIDLDREMARFIQIERNFAAVDFRRDSERRRANLGAINGSRQEINFDMRFAGERKIDVRRPLGLIFRALMSRPPGIKGHSRHAHASYGHVLAVGSKSEIAGNRFGFGNARNMYIAHIGYLHGGHTAVL